MSAKQDKQNDLEVIAPLNTVVMVADVKCEVRRVRTRELMLVARVLTAGLGNAIKDMEFDGDEWQSTMTAALVMAIPEAHEEFLQLLRVLVVPVEKIEDDGAENAFRAEMENPDPEVALEVLGALVAQEADTFQQLLGKAKTILQAAQALFRTGKATKKTTG